MAEFEFPLTTPAPPAGGSAIQPSYSPPAAASSIDFGSDLQCATDLDPMMRELAANDPRLVAESDLRRLQTPRGGLLDDPDYGYDVRELLRAPLTRAQLAAVPGRIRAELMKDDRHRSVDVDVKRTSSDELYLRIHAETDAGPFDMTGPITADEIRLEVRA